jgi:hypothetical protein
VLVYNAGSGVWGTIEEVGARDFEQAWRVNALDAFLVSKMMPDKPDSFFVRPADVAESVWQLTQQARSAWSFELEARPFGESW